MNQQTAGVKKNFFSLHKILNKMLPVEWAVPQSLEHGVFTTNYAFLKAREQKENPVKIAQEVVEKLNRENEKNYQLKIVFKNAGPYINVDFLPEFLIDFWQNFEVNLAKSNKVFFLEYVSPNVAKPLHVGHLRNINIGESLFRILRLKYKNIITDNHWGDWGVQFGILIWAQKNLKGGEKVFINDSLESVFDEKDDEITRFVKMYIWANQQQGIVQNWDSLVRDEFLKLEQGDEKNLKIWREIVTKSQFEIKKNLDSLGVTPHQLNFGESFYENEIKKIGEILEKENIWQKDGEARFFDFKHIWGDLQKMGQIDEKTQSWFKSLVQKSDENQEKNLGRGYLLTSKGYSTYLFRDIAARFVWLRDYDADFMLTLVDHTQNHHLRQVFAISFYLSQHPSIKKWFKKPVKSDNFESLGYGFITLPEGKMSTRKGNFFTANDLVKLVEGQVKERVKDENLSQKEIFKIAIAAIRWADLSKDWKNDIVLNINEILKFEGNTGVYQLYTVVRLNSILQKNIEFIKNGPLNKTDSQFLDRENSQILKQIFTFENVLESVIRERKPHILANYIYELSTKINVWYGKNNIIKEENLEKKVFLLKFVAFLKKHLEFCLNLLAIETVEKM